MMRKQPLVYLLVLVCFSCFLPSHIISAQTLSGALGGAAPAPAAEAPKADPLKRESPRAAIYAFLQACHSGDYNLAAQYLDLKKIRSDLRTTQGPELARQLASILDRDTQFEIFRLSDNPNGRSGDGLASNLDKLNDTTVNQRDLVLYMQRQTINAQQLWVVSADSVSLIPQIFSTLQESPIEKKLPAPLVTTRLLGTALWIWLALVIAALLVAAFSRLMARAALSLIHVAAKRYSGPVHAQRLEALVPPLRLILSVIVFRPCMEFIGPSVLLRASLLKILALLFIGSIAAIVMVLVDVVSDTMMARLNIRERAVSHSVFPLLVRSVKICVGFFAALVVLGAWGYNVNAVLAGLGVGGIAVALAAQKTIENLFGGVSVITDKPVLVGDFCQFGGQVGTVEDIGLRSTRIRTLDRTIVTIPNSSFSSMTLENFSKRDRMWFHPTLHLRRDTTPEKIRAMMDAIVTVLTKQDLVDPTDVPVRFTKISKESFDLEIFAYVNSPDFNVYLKTQSEMLLKIVEAARQLGVEFAVPIQEALPVSIWKATEEAENPDEANASNKAPTTGS
jgi:MscS family membrane protein